MDLPGRFRRQPWILVHFAVAGVAVFLAFSLHADSGGVMLLTFAVMGLLPVLVWLAAWWRPTILENSCCAYLGDISYAVYPLHLTLAILLQKPLNTASFHCLEMQARRWLLRRFRKR